MTAPKLSQEAEEALDRIGSYSGGLAATLRTELARIGARAAAAERARIKSILGSYESTNREKQAATLALESDLPVDIALALLKNAPSEATRPAGYKTIEERAAELQEAGPGGYREGRGPVDGVFDQFTQPKRK